MAQILVNLPVEVPIQVDTDVWLVPCTINVQNIFEPILQPIIPVHNKHQIWSSQEDISLCRLIEIHGDKKWKEVARDLNAELYGNNQVRKARQCRERWNNHLDPQILKAAWTLQEDLLLLDTQDELGHKWRSIADRLVGRTENQVRNRFNSLSRKAEQKYPNATHPLLFFKSFLRSSILKEEQTQMIPQQTEDMFYIHMDAQPQYYQQWHNAGVPVKQEYQAEPSQIRKLPSFSSFLEVENNDEGVTMEVEHVESYGSNTSVSKFFVS